MANETYIIVPPGLTPVHSFDLYGPIVDSKALSEQSIGLFQEIAEEEGISPEEAAKIVSDYRALARGEPGTTGERKVPIINALEDPLNRHPELLPDYKVTFQEDGLYVMREILEAGEGVIVFSSKTPAWLRENLPEDIGARIGEMYGDRKHRPEAFQKVYSAEGALGRRVITHTADELPELEAAVASGLFAGDNGRLIFANRNDSVNISQALDAGVNIYVDNLRDVGYTKLVEK